ncbi:hypothetical protein FIBSPDRAFT_1045657 [Athelia psychrophila]|uniref:Uncharacterized protein n=1 Tax=Athelia psychrophila TaxID=1759441 RepID=A0A166HW25_9AGAM|nr:hypothetical protein FIBSPDRAFT_1045657 [Fibularhizoctonia sp. CBS 109695]
MATFNTTDTTTQARISNLNVGASQYIIHQHYNFHGPIQNLTTHGLPTIAQQTPFAIDSSGRSGDQVPELIDGDGPGQSKSFSTMSEMEIPVPMETIPSNDLSPKLRKTKRISPFLPHTPKSRLLTE